MGDSIVGQCGLMPEDMMLRKTEKSCLFEDPNQFNTYMRQELKDFRPDPPSLASDLIRGGMEEDENGEKTRSRGYQGYGVLELRHTGRRSEAEPYLPDGTFLDHQFVGPGPELEPRSIMYQPDMRKHVEQQKARGRFIKYYPDSDESIPEKGWHPYTLVKQLAESRSWVKDRLKIFDTERVGWHNGSSLVVPLIKKSKVADTVYDAEFSTEGPTMRTRTDHVTAGSNSIPTGWQSVTDNRFKVAQYGRLNPTMLDREKDWYQNRRNVNTDHDIFVSVEDKPVTFATALAIIDLTRKRKEELSAERYNINFAKSEKQLNRQKQLTQEMIGHMIQQTQAQSHTEHRSGMKNYSVAERKLSQNNGKSAISHEMAKSMLRINQKMSKRERKDLREQIEQTAAAAPESAELANSTAADYSGDIVGHKHTSEVVVKGKEKKTANYKHAALPQSATLPMYGYEDFAGQSAVGAQRRGALTKKPVKKDSTDLEIEFGLDNTKNRHIRPMGDKFVRQHTSKMEDDEDNMNDRV